MWSSLWKRSLSGETVKARGLSAGLVQRVSVGRWGTRSWARDGPRSWALPHPVGRASGRSREEPDLPQTSCSRLSSSFLCGSPVTLLLSSPLMLSNKQKTCKLQLAIFYQKQILAFWNNICIFLWQNLISMTLKIRKMWLGNSLSASGKQWKLEMVQPRLGPNINRPACFHMGHGLELFVWF